MNQPTVHSSILDSTCHTIGTILKCDKQHESSLSCLLPCKIETVLLYMLLLYLNFYPFYRARVMLLLPLWKLHHPNIKCMRIFASRTLFSIFHCCGRAEFALQKIRVDRQLMWLISLKSILFLLLGLVTMPWQLPTILWLYQ